MSPFGHALRRARTDIGMSQDALARAAEMDRGHLSKIENGRIGLPSPAVVERLARAMGTSASALYARAGIRSPVDGDDAIDDDLTARVQAVVSRWTPRQRQLLWDYIEGVEAALDERDPPTERTDDESTRRTG